jgi:hypothetical protein
VVGVAASAIAIQGWIGSVEFESLFGCHATPHAIVNAVLDRVDEAVPSDGTLRAGGDAHVLAGLVIEERVALVVPGGAECVQGPEFVLHVASIDPGALRL